MVKIFQGGQTDKCMEMHTEAILKEGIKPELKQHIRKYHKKSLFIINCYTLTSKTRIMRMEDLKT